MNYILEGEISRDHFSIRNDPVQLQTEMDFIKKPTKTQTKHKF